MIAHRSGWRSVHPECGARGILWVVGSELVPSQAREPGRSVLGTSAGGLAVSFGRRLAVLAASAVVVAVILLMVHDFVDPGVFVLMVVAGALLVYIIQPIAVAWEGTRQRRRMAPTPPGAESLIGDVAVVIEAIDPVGMVKIHGETWRARSQPGEVLKKGERVVVVSCRELELVVRRKHLS